LTSSLTSSPRTWSTL